MRNIVLVGIESLVAFFFLSQGLYITTRDLPTRKDQANWWNRPGLWAGMGMVLASWFFVGVAVQTTISDKGRYIFWSQLTWWTIPFAAAFWFWAVKIIVSDENEQLAEQTWRRAFPLLALLACALLFAGLGVFSEFIFDYSGTREGLRHEVLGRVWHIEAFYIPANDPGHPLYIAFLSGGLLVCSFLLYRQFRRTKRGPSHKQALKWLYRGSGIVALGSAVATILFGEFGLAPEQLGDLITALGLLVVGLGVIRYNALVEDQVIWEDVRRMGLGIILVVLIYLSFTVGVFHFLDHPSPPAALYLPPLIYLAILTHSLAGTAGLLLDRVTLSPYKAEYRFDLARSMRTIITSRDPVEKLKEDEEELPRKARTARARAKLQDEKKVIRAVKDLLQQRPLDDIGSEQLGSSLLKDLGIVQEVADQYTRLPAGASDTDIEVLALKDFLRTFMSEDLRPPGEEPYPLTLEWRDFLLLYLRYVRGWKLEDVKDHLASRLRPEDVPGSDRTWRSWYGKAKPRLGKRIYDAEKRFLLRQIGS